MIKGGKGDKIQTYEERREKEQQWGGKGKKRSEYIKTGKGQKKIKR